jgi:dethiobiotin synthase
MKTVGLFITGTDTGVGKTWISRLLIDNAPRSMVATYMKPVQTGCTDSKGGILVAPDFEYVAMGAMKMAGRYQDHVPYRFRHACSPHLASRLEQRPIGVGRILAAYGRISAKAGLVVVEGAGGVLVPLSEKAVMLDLIQALRIPVLVVTRPHLGTLNHTRLTLERLRSAGIVVAGAVINNTDGSADDYIARENRRVIMALAAPAPVINIGFGQSNGTRIERFCRAVISRL